MSLGDTLMIRLVFVLLGTLVVLSIIFVFLQSRRSMTISHKMSEMERVDERLLDQIRIDIEHGQADSDRSIQLLYYLHMNASILGSLANKVGDTMADEVKRLIEANYQFAMDAAHAIVFLNSDIKKQRFAHLRGTTINLENEVRMQKSRLRSSIPRNIRLDAPCTRNSSQSYSAPCQRSFNRHHCWSAASHRS